jgi:phosphoribosylaminoimidazole-succinocarboxamide synthase
VKSENTEILTTALKNTIQEVDLPGLGVKINGKVRDCYVRGTKRVLVSSDRLSAFDVILTTIPYKGKILNDLAAFWFEKTKHIVKNHLISRPHPNIFIGEEVEIIPIEVVVRGYLAGSAFRDYQAGKDISGIKIPSGMKKSEKFSEPLVTPSTKAIQGEHDMPISEAEIISSKIVPENIWNDVRTIALKLFNFGSNEVRKRGLILVDTKYEFGIKKYPDGTSEIILADEVHTQDSSRFWQLDTYEEMLSIGEDPEMLDKEFVRKWLIQSGYMGDGTPPKFTDAFRVQIAQRYIEAFEIITGEKFVFETTPFDKNLIDRIKLEVSK